jgi:hypothetical protein
MILNLHCYGSEHAQRHRGSDSKDSQLITRPSELCTRDSRTAEDRVLSQPPAQTKELARLHTRPA